MFRTIYVALGISIFAIFSVLVLYPIVTAISFISEKQAIMVSKKIIKYASKFLVFLTGSKVETILKDDKIFENIKDEPVVLISNHQSHMDTPFLIANLEKDFGFIAKKEMEKWPIISSWMQKIQCIFIDRSSAREGLKSIKSGAEKIKQGYSVAIFPEGTRSKTGEIKEFKKGSLKLAAYSGAKILPVTIKGTIDVMRSGELKIRKSKQIKLIVDNVIDTKQLDDGKRKALSQYVWNTIVDNYNSF